MQFQAVDQNSPEGVSVHRQMPTGLLLHCRGRDQCLLDDVQLRIEDPPPRTSFPDRGQHLLVSLARQAGAQGEIALRGDVDAVPLADAFGRLPLVQLDVDSGSVEPCVSSEPASPAPTTTILIVRNYLNRDDLSPPHNGFMSNQPDPLAGPIGGQLYLAHRYARAATNRALQAHDVELRHLGVLGTLAEAGPMSQRALVDRLQLDKSSMVYIIDELERQGLAARHKDERDRRSYAVHITPAGLDRLAAASDTAAEMMTGLLAPLAPDERQQLHDLLARFIEHAAAQ